MCRIILLILFVLYKGLATAQPAQKVIQVKGHYGFIFAHSQAVQNTAGARPRGLELELGRQKVDTATWTACRCFPIKSFNISYFDFNTRVLGQAVNVAYVLEPAYRLGRRGQFSFKAGTGLSFATRPYHPNKNPTNMSYSLPVSGYLQLGVGLAYRTAPHWWVKTSAQYQHISNGGIKEPNKGVNWPTASVGVMYVPGAYTLPRYNSLERNVTINKKPYLDAGVFVSARQGRTPAGETPRTYVAGAFANLEKQVATINAINAGLEISYDRSLYQRLKLDSLAGSPVRIGLLAGHNFLLGKFFFSQQLGVYVLRPSKYYSLLYHRWTVRYQLQQKWQVGIGLLAHKQVADFIDLRVSHRIR